MKTKILTIQGKGKEITLPKLFEIKIREDIAQKYFEVCKHMNRQPYGPNPSAGKGYSASGKISHRRHKWKTHYGHGISRVPRKILWRRGNQFYWVAATVPQSRGGRRAHPPKIEHFNRKKRINKKEILIALKSGFASTTSKDWIKKRYETLKNSVIKNVTLPLVIDNKVLTLKTKEIIKFFETNLKEIANADNLIKKKKTIRPGKGKMRNRKYKSTAGMLLIIGNEEKKKITGIDVKKLGDIEMKDLFPLGRIVAYTEEAIKELGKVNDEVKE